MRTSPDFITHSRYWVTMAGSRVAPMALRHLSCCSALVCWLCSAFTAPHSSRPPWRIAVAITVPRRSGLTSSARSPVRRAKRRLLSAIASRSPYWLRAPTTRVRRSAARCPSPSLETHPTCAPMSLKRIRPARQSRSCSGVPWRSVFTSLNPPLMTFQTVYSPSPRYAMVRSSTVLVLSTPARASAKASDTRPRRSTVGRAPLATAPASFFHMPTS
mmetsp:Transcript_63706/g.201481  ORF Transcript_63706/g.201481 Transcript_63706/m.201481 type:complete len:216 (-) Transcript_63706:717-1364(-)